MTTRQLLVAAAALLLLVALVVRLEHHGGAAAGAVLADAGRTPGVLNPDVTQATIRSTIDYTDELKRRQIRAYHESGPSSAYQEDHLTSLELGGHPTDPRNLWPEPYPRASEVYSIENELNAKVCSGDLSLEQA